MNVKAGEPPQLKIPELKQDSLLNNFGYAFVIGSPSRYIFSV